jgi:hypothetical protein
MSCRWRQGASRSAIGRLVPQRLFSESGQHWEIVLHASRQPHHGCSLIWLPACGGTRVSGARKIRSRWNGPRIDRAGGCRRLTDRLECRELRSSCYVSS